MTATVEVVTPGLLTLVCDGGRRGYEHLGVMVGGTLDAASARLANRLLGNDPDDAVLEVTLAGPTLAFADGGTIALAGADLSCTVDGTPFEPGSMRRVPPGALVAFGRQRRGARAYLAFAGGLDVAPVLGSRSTDTVARFGGVDGRALRRGDRFKFDSRDAAPARAIVADGRDDGVIRVLPGPACDGFDEAALAALERAPWRVGRSADRIGLRLEGERIERPPQNGISKGVAIGAVEIPPSGEPLVLLASRGAVGGYPTLAVTIAADLPLLGQLAPGDGVRFAVVSRDDARTALDDAGRAITIRMQAPEWCVVEDPIAAGTHVVRGARLATLRVFDRRAPLFAPCRGRIAAAFVPEGYDAPAGATLFDLQPPP